MVDADFSEWLSQKSWAQGVRFCKVIAVLIPVVALGVDVPLLNNAVRMAQPGWIAVMIWHAVAEVTCLVVIVADKFWFTPARAEALTNSLAVVLLVLSACFGVISWINIRDFSIYALGTVFVATAISTPRHVRRPIYAICVGGILMVVYWQSSNATVFADALVDPVCVGLVAFLLDRYAYERNVELFAEKQRAEYERARADKVLYNVFPVSIADELKRDERVNAVKFEGMGVMFSDIVGFTSFSKSLPPDALVFVLNQIFSMFDQLVDRYNLEKIKTIGDAYMVVSQKQTQSLAQLALDMLEGMKAYNLSNGTDFQLRIGLHVGPAVAGVIGVKRFLYDVWGDTVNVASRMESNGEPGRIHVTQAVQMQLAGQFAFAARAPIEVKGKGTMATYFLSRLEPPSAPGSDTAAALPAAAVP